MSDLTQLLDAARGGDREAAGKAYGLLYDELRRLAAARLRPHRAMTLLDTTSVVHEAYLRIVGGGGLPVESRRHFFAYASQVMRSVIVDAARAKQSGRRGGGVERVVLDTGLAERIGAPETDVLRVHEALEVLAQADARLAQVVEMRFFGGMTEAEIALALNVSERTVRRDWEKARLLLIEQLS